MHNGRQLDCTDYRAWRKRKSIEPPYASRESLRATAVIERFFLSLKDEWLRRIVVPLDRKTIRRELPSYVSWSAEHRTHQGLDGMTPNEVYDGSAADEIAPQEQQKPKTLTHRELVVRYHEGKRQLPNVELRRAV